MRTHPPFPSGAHRDHLGRHVLRGADEGARVAEGSRVLRRAELPDEQRVVLGEEEVLRLA